MAYKRDLCKKNQAVIPVKTGIHKTQIVFSAQKIDSRFRGNDNWGFHALALCVDAINLTLFSFQIE